MASIENILNNIGDSIAFKSVPFFGLRTITSWNYDSVGITSTRTVNVLYRYSFNGINFTDWNDTTNLIVDVNNDIENFVPFQTPILEFMFERTGSDATGQIIINSILLNGTYDIDQSNFPVSSKTPFANLVDDDLDVWNLMINLTKKIYEVGIVPIYLQRGDAPNDLYNDRDYVDVWSMAAKTFAVLFQFGIQFSVIYWRIELLTEFLAEKTIQFCPETTIDILQLLAKNYYDEIRQRGTIEIFRRKDYEYPLGYRNSYALTTGFIISSANPIYINGIKYNENDELPFGWIIVSNSLNAPDNQYYNIEIVDNSTLPVITGDFDYSIIDTLPRIDITSNVIILDPSYDTSIKRKYHGEYLRMICYNIRRDEFMFNFVNDENKGWCLGHNSPLWKGLRQHENTTIIKGYENFSQEVWDLNYYPIIGSGIPLETFRIAYDNSLELIDNGSGNHLSQFD